MSTQNIVPRDCSYNCGTRIYWNTSENAYFEVFTKKKHICKNRSNNIASGNLPQTNNTTNRSYPFYNKKPWSNAPKPKMSNSLELLTGPIDTIQRKYEILSDIVINEYNGKVHGSQSHILPNNSLQLIVYFEVVEGRLNDFKQRFYQTNKVTANWH